MNEKRRRLKGQQAQATPQGETQDQCVAAVKEDIVHGKLPKNTNAQELCRKHRNELAP